MRLEFELGGKHTTAKGKINPAKAVPNVQDAKQFR